MMLSRVVRRHVAAWVLCGAGVAAGLALTPARAAAQVTAYAYVPDYPHNTVDVIDTRANDVVDTVTLPWYTYAFSAVFTPDGRRAFIGDTAWDVWMVDVSTHSHSRVNICCRELGPYGLAVTHDGQKLYVVDAYNNRVNVVDINANTIVQTLTVGTFPTSIALTPDGQRAWVTNLSSSTISVIDTSTDTLVGSPISLGSNVGPSGVAFTPDGTRAYVSGQGQYGPGHVTLINVADGAILTTIPIRRSIGILMTPDGSKVLVADAASAVQVIDTATNTFDPANAIAVGNTPEYLALTPDGKTAYVTNYGSDTVSVIDIASLSVVKTIAVGDKPEGGNGFVGPNIITTNCTGCGPLDITSDADLTPIPFGQFLPFNNGILSLHGDWTTNRTISVLAGGATLRTNGFNTTIQNGIIGEGALTLEGVGHVTLNGTATHAGGTILQNTNAALTVNGSHNSPVHLQSGYLNGRGTIGTIDATGGVIYPGDTTRGILHAGTATFGPGILFVVHLNGTVAGTGYDQLAADSAALGNATLVELLDGYTPAPGESFTIATHVSGTFNNLPEGSLLFPAAGVRLRITYHGGSGSDAVLIADNQPTLSGLSDQTIAAGSALGPLAFTVGDDVTPASALMVSASSSNQTLLPNADIVFGGSGSSRTLSATPVPGASGTTTIRVTVSDGWQTAQQTFTLTVLNIPVYYLAEGATGSFFDTDLLLANPNSAPAPVVITFYKDDGTMVVQNLTLAATSRTTLRVSQIAGLESAAFSTSVTSTNGLPLAVERTMWWDGGRYGSSGEKASAAAASQWYFAEGSQGFFHTYYLLLNPHAVATIAHATWFLDDGNTIQRDYAVPATSRVTIDAASEPALLNRSFGARFTFDLPGMAERAMYFGDAPQFTGGHAAAGVTAPGNTWYLAEGATGTYFDTFVLVANPNAAAATVTLTYLPDNGVPIAKTHTIAANQRLTINIADEDPALASSAVSTRVDADQPVVAERSQYWPHPSWYEAHNSTGETTPGTKWGLAEGRVGGTNNAQTYILIANPGPQTANVTATFLRTDGTTLVKTFTVAPTSRFNISVTGSNSSVPELTDESFGTVIDSTQPVIVERSFYTNANSLTWAAGTNATATRLP